MIKIRYNSTFSILNFALLLMLLIFMQSCSTSSKTATLSGSVILNNDTGNSALDPADYSGVTVALYHPAELDEDIRAVNLSHPNLGVIITQQTEFDHRLQSPYKTAVTAGDGSFALKGIKPGTYNLVVMKQGWGVRYLYNVSITEGDNSLAGKGIDVSRNGVELYPALELSGLNAEVYEFKSQHSYLVTDDVTYASGLTFSPGTYVWIAPDKKITVYGSAATPPEDSEWVRVTSSDRMYETTAVAPSGLSRCYNISFANQVQFEQNRICSFLITFSKFGLSVKSPDLSIFNLVIRYCRQGLSIEQTGGITVAQCNVSRTDDVDLGGITYSNGWDISTGNLIVMNCTTGIRQLSNDNADISNCYFKNNSNRDIYNLYDNTGSITHCTFINSNTAIYTSGKSDADIQYCDIDAVIGIDNRIQPNWAQSWFTANYNNLNCSQIAVRTQALFYSAYYFDATNNYWGTTNAATIYGDLIWDRTDEDPNNEDYYRMWGIINYSPYRVSRVQTAGVTAD
jgi:hypothetical protein